MSQKTAASVQDNRLTIFAKDAKTPAVTTIPLDQAAAGSFELTAQPDGGMALSFKPAGKNTIDTVAIYADAKKATRALEIVFAALGKGGKKSGFSSFIGGTVKVIGLVILIIILLVWLVGWVFSGIFNNGAIEQLVDNPPQADQELPVGVPISVDDFINLTQEQETEVQP